MKIILFSILLSVFPFNFLSLYAQLPAKQYVYSNIANVRSLPAAESEKTDELFCGDEITVLEEVEKSTRINGYTKNWVKIAYNKNGQEKAGYTWKGNLSLDKQERGNVKFIFGIDSFDSEKNQRRGAVKAVVGNEVIDQKPFESSATRSEAVGKIIDDPYLDNVKNILMIDFYRDACGEFGEKIYFAWSGHELNYMLTCTEASDAGAFFDLESLRLPDEDDGSQILIKLTRQGEMEDGDSAYKCSYTTELYEWKGDRAEPVE